ncbi:MAG: SDR family oxidoreductase [Actinobacteria bacterium]|nr:SDR family oxidoreductase [Actinomycetota bacterium]
MNEHLDLRGQFAGKYAVVTGSTQGIGEAVARLLAERGCAGLVICGRNQTNGDRVAAELRAAGCPTTFVRVDLGQLPEARAVVHTADAQFGNLHVLVNCAAVTDRGSILDATPELFDRVFNVNVRAPFFLMQDAARIMLRERTPGAIVNILSINAYGGDRLLAPYSSSKGALLTLTRNAANHLSEWHIRVNGVGLGWTDTPAEDVIQRTFHGAPADWVAQAERRLPFGRMIKPPEVARLVAFLASEESGLMTGTVVDLAHWPQGTFGNR